MNIYFAFILFCCLSPLFYPVRAWDPKEHQIEQMQTTFYLSEASSVGSLVYHLAESLKWSDRSYYLYSIKDGANKVRYFDIDNEGKIRLIRPINYESTPEVIFTVNVYNNDSKFMEYYVDVKADVFDVNEAAPVFSSDQQDEFTFDVIPPVGTHITTVKASDDDTDDVLTFSIDNDSFKITSNTAHSGAITVAKQLKPYSSYDSGANYRTSLRYDASAPLKASYPLIVTVSDGKHETKKLFTVHISSQQTKSISNARSAVQDPPTNNPILKNNYHYPSNSQDEVLQQLLFYMSTTPGIAIITACVVIILGAFVVVFIIILKTSNYRYPPNGPLPPTPYYSLSQYQPPSTTNSQNITQSRHIYGDRGLLNNNLIPL